MGWVGFGVGVSNQKYSTILSQNLRKIPETFEFIKKPSFNRENPYKTPLLQTCKKIDQIATKMEQCLDKKCFYLKKTHK